VARKPPTIQAVVAMEIHRGMRYIAARTGQSISRTASDVLTQYVGTWTDPATGEGVPSFVLGGEARP